MWSLRWTENPEERDRNPSAPQNGDLAQNGRAEGGRTLGPRFDNWSLHKCRE